MLQTKIWLWRSEKIARDNIINTFKLFTKQKKIAAITNFQFVNANQLRANIVNTLAWYSIAVLSRLYQVLQHTPLNISGKQLNNCSRQNYCLLQLEYWTLKRITICQARSYEDQVSGNLQPENPISMKHEKRHRHAHLTTLHRLGIHKATWCCFLATQEV